MLKRALIVLAVALALGLPAGAQATPPSPVTIENPQVFTGPDSTAGTFVATGAVSDSGTTAETFRIDGRTVHALKTYAGSLGTFTVTAQGLITFTGATTAVLEGRWLVVSGTGAYANLHAEGSLVNVVDLAAGTSFQTVTGQGHFD